MRCLPAELLSAALVLEAAAAEAALPVSQASLLGAAGVLGGDGCHVVVMEQLRGDAHPDVAAAGLKLVADRDGLPGVGHKAGALVQRAAVLHPHPGEL